jgi:hypothetical protein
VIRQTTTLSLLVLGAFSVNSIVQSRCFSFYSSSGEQLPRQLGSWNRSLARKTRTSVATSSFSSLDFTVASVFCGAIMPAYESNTTSYNQNIISLLQTVTEVTQK